MREISVYIHFPWCQRKCPYCDFATLPGDTDTIPHALYADQVLRELAWRREELLDRKLISVFFGGGTPSLWDAPSLARVTQGVLDSFSHHSDDLEITVECNPISLRAEWLSEIAEAGINRASIGVQSTVAKELEFLGRLHNTSQATKAIETGLSILNRVSADLMFGMPDQSSDSLLNGIDQLLDLGIQHVSAYSLTVEPATRFGTLAKAGKLRLASEDTFARLFLRAQALFEERGFTHYEVSNYAMVGESSRHNEHYWRGGEYLGLGAAAVGCIASNVGQARRYRNAPTPRRYLQASLNHASLEESSEELSPQDIIREALMLGLRTQAGVDLKNTQHRAGQNPLENRETAWHRRQCSGDLIVEEGFARVPHARWLHLDSIIADLF